MKVFRIMLFSKGFEAFRLQRISGVTSTIQDQIRFLWGILIRNLYGTRFKGEVVNCCLPYGSKLILIVILQNVKNLLFI